VLFVTYSTWNIGLLMHMSDAQHHCARFIYHSHLLDVQVPLAALPSRGSEKHPWFQIQLQRRWFSFWKITMAFHGMKTATNHTLTLIHPPFLQVQGGFFVASPMFSPQLYQCSARQVPQRLRHTMLTKASAAPRQRRPHATRGAA